MHKHILRKTIAKTVSSKKISHIICFQFYFFILLFILSFYLIWFYIILSAFSSAFAVNVKSFVFKSDSSTRLEISDSSTNFFLFVCIKHFFCEFIIIRTCEVFFSVSNILVLKSVFLTKPPTSGILFSTSLIFVLRTAVVTKSLVPGILS